MRKTYAILLLSIVLVVKAKKNKQSLSVRVNQGVNDLYKQAEDLQERAYKRVYELQERSRELQSNALTKAERLQKRAEELQARASSEIQQLQQEVSQELGELKATIENLPIPPAPPREEPEEQVVEEPEPVVAEPEPVVEEVVEEPEVFLPPEEPVAPPAPPKSKLANARERTVPAVLMLGGLAAYVKFGGSFIPLIFLIQVGLFAETTSVVNLRNLSKWWWFATVVLGTNGQFLSWPYAREASYGMGVVGLVAWVIKQNVASAGAQVFRSNLATLAATHLALLVLIGQSSFWLATVQEYGLTWILFPAFLVMINDTMAYVFGMLFGKHPLLPIISPKKTWEGFFGATLSTLAISQPLLAYMLTEGDTMLTQHALSMATFISLVSPFGGFLASVVKRAYGKKDFATWIPGHGGVVDRLDCQVMTAPFVYFYLNQFMKVAAASSE